MKDLSVEESTRRLDVLPPDGTYSSKAGVDVRVIRRPVPDSTLGFIEIELRYGRGGAPREAYFLEHHESTPVRLNQVFVQLLNDISPLGEPYPVRSETQKAVTARLSQTSRSTIQKVTSE
jgi:hypothetical protein